MFDQNSQMNQNQRNLIGNGAYGPGGANAMFSQPGGEGYATNNYSDITNTNRQRNQKRGFGHADANMIQAPKSYKNDPEDEEESLAYITDEELAALQILDLHQTGVSPDNPKFGPGGIPSAGFGGEGGDPGGGTGSSGGVGGESGSAGGSGVGGNGESAGGPGDGGGAGENGAGNAGGNGSGGDAGTSGGHGGPGAGGSGQGDGGGGAGGGGGGGNGGMGGGAGGGAGAGVGGGVNGGDPGGGGNVGGGGMGANNGATGSGDGSSGNADSPGEADMGNSSSESNSNSNSPDADSNSNSNANSAADSQAAENAAQAQRGREAADVSNGLSAVSADAPSNMGMQASSTIGRASQKGFDMAAETAAAARGLATAPDPPSPDDTSKDEAAAAVASLAAPPSAVAKAIANPQTTMTKDLSRLSTHRMAPTTTQMTQAKDLSRVNNVKDALSQQISDVVQGKVNAATNVGKNFGALGAHPGLPGVAANESHAGRTGFGQSPAGAPSSVGIDAPGLGLGVPGVGKEQGRVGSPSEQSDRDAAQDAKSAVAKGMDDAFSEDPGLRSEDVPNAPQAPQAPEAREPATRSVSPQSKEQAKEQANVQARDKSIDEAVTAAIRGMEMAKGFFGMAKGRVSQAEVDHAYGGVSGYGGGQDGTNGIGSRSNDGDKDTGPKSKIPDWWKKWRANWGHEGLLGDAPRIDTSASLL